MNIAFVNGSPKSGQGNNSGILLKLLRKKFKRPHCLSEYAVKKRILKDGQIAELCGMDAIVVSFPLYYDALPAHLLYAMKRIEEYIKNNGLKCKVNLYAIANNGFYEGRQNEIALEIIKNWCARIEFTYGQGIGQGAGEMLPFLENIPSKYGPLKNLDKALSDLAANVESGRKGNDILLSPNFPYFAWKFVAENFFWNRLGKKNGLSRKDLLARPQAGTFCL
jgi:hypothetical protein